MPRGRRPVALVRLAAATAVCAVLGTALAPGASADPFSDGQWYVTPFKLEANHQIAKGTGVTVAVLDGVVSPSAPSLAGATVVPASSTPCFDRQGKQRVTGTGVEANHATAMTAMIVGQGGANVPLGVAPGAKVLTYTIGYGTPDNPLALECLDKPGGVSKTDEAAGDAIRDAVSKGARIISMSYSARNASASTQVAIQYAEQKGVVFVASTDDQQLPAGQTRVVPPGVFNGVVLVNGIDPDAKIVANAATGNPDGPLVVASAPGQELALGGYTEAGAWNPDRYSNGSSPATAFVAGVLATTLSKWPKATGNQLIQSLARNTGGEQHDLEPRALDGYGYGVVSLTSMLKNDPTAYPDENPTLRDGAVPSTGDILGSSTAGPTDSTAPSSGSSSGSDPTTGSSSAPTPIAATPAASDGGTSTGLVVGIVIGVVVLLAIVALVVVLMSRRGRRRGPPPSGPPPTGPPSYAPGGYAR